MMEMNTQRHRRNHLVIFSWLQRLAFAAAGIAVLCYDSSANASIYDVNFSFIDQANDTIPVTGDIVTTCDNCSLTGLNISSWSFSWGGQFAGSASGTGANVGTDQQTVLQASGGIIQFVPPSGSRETFNDSLIGGIQVSFGLAGNTTCSFGGDHDNCISIQGLNFTHTVGLVDLPFTIATGEVSAVPEPSTWAMMLIGFAGVGYFGFCQSRQRKVAAG